MRTDIELRSLMIGSAALIESKAELWLVFCVLRWALLSLLTAFPDHFQGELRYGNIQDGSFVVEKDTNNKDQALENEQ